MGQAKATRGSGAAGVLPVQAEPITAPLPRPAAEVSEQGTRTIASESRKLNNRPLATLGAAAPPGTRTSGAGRAHAHLREHGRRRPRRRRCRLPAPGESRRAPRPSECQFPPAGSVCRSRWVVSGAWRAGLRRHWARRLAGRVRTPPARGEPPAREPVSGLRPPRPPPYPRVPGRSARFQPVPPQGPFRVCLPGARAGRSGPGLRAAGGGLGLGACDP